MSNQSEIIKRDGLLTAQDAANAIGVHISTVYRWIYSGKLAGSKIGFFVYVKADDLLSQYQGSPEIQKRIRQAVQA
jgi:excisionase family DNA binding protein